MNDFYQIPAPVQLVAEVSIAANATNDNVMRDQQYQTAPFDCYLTLRDTGSATGLRRSLLISGRSIVDRGFVNTNNRVPIVPDDLITSNVPVRAGQQITLPVFNTTAGALTFRAIIDLVPAWEG